MIVLPTLNGGVKLVIERERDWDFLKSIGKDVAKDFPARFSSLMDEDSMWDEIVQPELTEEFSSQIRYVIEQVERVYDESVSDYEEELPEICLTQGEAEIWYGALNQARLSIWETQKEGKTDLAEANEQKRREVIFTNGRYRFYGMIQEAILDYVMD